MMNKIFVAALLSVLYVVSAQVQNTKTCYYDAESTTYSFEGLGYETQGWLNGTDASNNVWYFQICQQSVSDVNASPCPDGSSVCVSMKGQTSSRGSTDSVQFSDSPFPNTDGFEVIFGAQSQEDSTEYKTVIEFLCSGDLEPVVTIVAGDSFTSITVNSSYACGMVWTDMGSWEESEKVIQIDVGALFIAFVSILVGCCVCCCCCVARRRRCQRNKNIAMKQFSNVAFQPIPAAKSTQVVQNSVPLPSYNPYIQQQPQFVYYYPNQQQQQTVVPSSPQFNQVVQLDDEKLARQLQAQFDQEAQV